MSNALLNGVGASSCSRGAEASRRLGGACSATPNGATAFVLSNWTSLSRSSMAFSSRDKAKPHYAIATPGRRHHCQCRYLMSHIVGPSECVEQVFRWQPWGISKAMSRYHDFFFFFGREYGRWDLGKMPGRAL